MNETKVEVGQIWRDNDKRHAERFVKVQSTNGEHAHCLSAYNKHFIGKTRRVKIRLYRFKPNSTGYMLVKD